LVGVYKRLNDVFMELLHIYLAIHVHNFIYV